MNSAREGVKDVEKAAGNRNLAWGTGEDAEGVRIDGGHAAAVAKKKRAEVPGQHARRQLPEVDADANAGSDYDAMPDSDVPLANDTFTRLSIPNSVFSPARILVNPRCVTTYAGVSHTQLALDLFGPEKDEDGPGGLAKYVLDDWEGAPESFVCQEQR